MIVASPRPIAAMSEVAPLLRLRADELQLQMAHLRMGMGVPVEAQSEEYQNGDRSRSGDQPPKYTRHSTSYPFTHTARPSTSSASSTTTASSSSTATVRPSFDSFDAPSEHMLLLQDQQQKELIQMGSSTRPLQSCRSETLESAPPYDSSFADTNLSGLPDDALTALSLARETLGDLERVKFDELDELDRSDDRADPDAIVQRRITRNALLARQSAITLASSVYSDGTQPARDSVYTSYDFDPARVSVQTYGSSVLTYGSRASQLLESEEVGNNDGDGSRPVAPLPWLPRPSALDRIQHSVPYATIGRARSGSTDSNSSSGRRPLPPLPTPTSATASTGPSPTLNGTRDRSISLPSRSASTASNYSVSSASSAGRRPRPLPRTPTSIVSNNLPDILESEGSDSVSPSSGPMRTNSMFLSPTSATVPQNFLAATGRRGSSVRYSTIGYGQVSRIGVRAAFLGRANGESGETTVAIGKAVNTSSQRQKSMRTASRASVRSARSTYLVPDVDELVRILDSMDNGSGSGSTMDSMPSNVLPGSWEPQYETKNPSEGEEEIDIGAVLARSRSVVNVPSGEKRGAAATLEGIGLPTPAATPRSSPQRQPNKLPSGSKMVTESSTIPRRNVESTEPDVQSPPPSSAGVLSLTSFPLPPMAPLHIPAPTAVGTDEMPIPSAISGGAPSPSLADFGKSPAERAMLPGMAAAQATQMSQQKHISARDAIADLKHRVAELPVFNLPSKKAALKKLQAGVPLLSLPVPPRRRAQSSASNTTPFTADAKRYPQPPAIDVRAANALHPPSSYTVGNAAGSSSAPAHNLTFDQEKPTIIYSTPAPAPVAPLRIRRGSSHMQMNVQSDAMRVHIPPAANVSQSASAAQTTFNMTSVPSTVGRTQRSTSFCVSPSSSPPAVAPLRFKSNKPGARSRNSTVGSLPLLSTADHERKQEDAKTEAVQVPIIRTSSDTDASEESEGDLLTTPTNGVGPSAANVVEHSMEQGCATGFSILSADSSLSAIQRATGHASIDPAFADIIKSMAGASEEEQMGSLLTIASSINTEHHASGYNAGFCLPFDDAGREDDEGFVDIEEEDENGACRKETVRKSMASGISTNDRRRNKGRSFSSMKKRQSTRSAAAVRAAIRALPDPSTFPIPGSAGSVATDSSALAGGADYSGFAMRPSPLPKLKVVTKFKGGAVLLPASSAPLSATSTKSSMSTAGGHSRNVSGVNLSAKRVSTAVGPRKMNRLTLTDPRSPMADAAVAAATLVSRVRQKRAVLAARGHTVGAGGAAQIQTQVIGLQRGHTRTGSGSSGTLRSKLKMSGSGFFGGSSARALRDPGPDADSVLHSGPRARRPTIHRTRREVALSYNGEVDLCT